MDAPIRLDASSISVFSASLANLPKEEITKAKLLFIRNAISDYHASLRATRGFLIVMGVMSIIPIFLLVFGPAFLAYRAAKINGREKILNAIEVWGEELGDEKAVLLAKLNC